MPAILPEKKQYLISRVRSIIARDHQIALDDLADRLNREFGIKIERHYLSQLVRKVLVERTKRADRATLNYALAAFEDSMTEVVKKAWEIANADYINPQARVMALREIREANSAVFEKLFDAGVFERKLGTLDMAIRNTPLAMERKDAIAFVFEAWKLPAKAEPAVEVKAIEAPKEDAAPATSEQP